jgi:hypothetical protein
MCKGKGLLYIFPAVKNSKKRNISRGITVGSWNNLRRRNKAEETYVSGILYRMPLKKIRIGQQFHNLYNRYQ